ncbi:MAG: DUF6273 domain-containing protein, partial [Oscillospiraceae bacterium]|nr:DUF6273 domain-containing protein [Oscillospiraceae bacterium]
GTPVGHNAHPEDLKLYDTGSGLSVDKPESGEYTVRVLPAAKAGDTSDWIEIAQSGGYSLILRANVLSIWPASGSNPYGSQTFCQHSSYLSCTSGTCDDWAHMNNNARAKINQWYGNELSPTEGLRIYAMTNNALTQKGSYDGFDVDLASGYSSPIALAGGSNTDNIAFLLSAQEAGKYCARYWHDGNDNMGIDYFNAPTGSWQALAYANWLALGDATGCNTWLRSTATDFVIYPSVSGSNNAGAHSYASTAQVCALRPALWVDSSIFAEPAQPTVGSGRKVDGGDGSMWTEIAVSGGYSLIVRDDNIKAKNFCIHTAYGQGCGTGCTDYLNSVAKTEIDGWYADVKTTTSLPIVVHAVGNDATENLGSFRTGVNMNTDDSGSGISRPVTGNPATAFLLSLEEASKFCCRGFYDGNTWSDRQVANDQVYQTWDSLSGKNDDYGWWLRSPNLDGNVCRVGSGGHVHDGGLNPWYSRGLRPALWVDSAIFGAVELDPNTPDNTTVTIDGREWIKIKGQNISGQDYALLLLKNSPNTTVTFQNNPTAGDAYEGSNLQAQMTFYYQVQVRALSPTLHNAAVIPNLNGSGVSAISTPTATMAINEPDIIKDVCFALSYQEAFEISGTGGADPIRAYEASWFTRSPFFEYYEPPGTLVLNVLQNGGLSHQYVQLGGHLRPAIWVKV